MLGTVIKWNSPILIHYIVYETCVFYLGAHLAPFTVDCLFVNTLIASYESPSRGAVGGKQTQKRFKTWTRHSMYSLTW